MTETSVLLHTGKSIILPFEASCIMNKTDRYILIGAVGIFLISMVYMVATVKYQSIEKENTRLSEREQNVTETQNTMIWREYHNQQMEILNAILMQLKENREAASVKCL